MSAPVSPSRVSALKTVSRITNATVIPIGPPTLSEDLFEWNLGIDPLLFEDPSEPVGTLYPGRPSPIRRAK